MFKEAPTSGDLAFWGLFICSVASDSRVMAFIYAGLALAVIVSQLVSVKASIEPDEATE